MSCGADHPVFKRLSRQQLIVRRRSVGFQVLTYRATTAASRCKHCGRHFNTVWKEYLCHVCGLWVCLPCSNVIEREREMHVIHFIRVCVECMSLVNKWPDPDLLTAFAVASWVVQCSKCQLALHLADTLRTKKDFRPAVLTLLKHFGRPAGVDAAILDEITEASWVATTTEAVDALELVPDESMDAGEGAPRKASDKREHAQFLVQQCFEVAVPELPIDECVFAESDGSREYPIYYDKVTETPKCPVIQKEQESSEWIADYGLLQRNLNTPEMALICELAAKELEATKAFISVVQDNEQHSVAVQPSFECGALERSQTFCAFALTSPHPFLVRDAVLDIRFRNLNVVRGDAHTQFYLGFPIVAQATGITIAELCIIDTKPRQHITTMQYSIIKKLSSIVSTLWAESYRGSER